MTVPATASPMPAPSKPRLLVRVMADFGGLVVHMEFHAKFTTVFRKLLLAWCREYCCLPDAVLLMLAASSGGQQAPVQLDKTFAQYGFRPSLEAIMVVAKPRPGAEALWPVADSCEARD